MHLTNLAENLAQWFYIFIVQFIVRFLIRGTQSLNKISAFIVQLIKHSNRLYIGSGIFRRQKNDVLLSKLANAILRWLF